MGERAAPMDMSADLNGTSRVADVVGVMAKELDRYGLTSLVVFDMSRWFETPSDAFLVRHGVEFMPSYGASFDFRGDPVFLRAQRRPAAFRWSVESDYDPMTAAPMRTVASLFRDARVEAGLIAPIHGRAGVRGVVAMSGPESIKLTPKDERALTMLALLGFERAATLTGAPPEGPSTRALKAKERACLQWLADGDEVAALGGRLREPDEVIQSLLASAASKLGARTPLQAVAAAIRSGVIQ